METVSTSPAPFARQLAIFRHNTVANCTLRLSFQRTYDIPLERGEPRYQVIVGEGNNTLRDA